MKQLYAEEKAAFRRRPQQAVSLLTVGDTKPDSHIPATELAA
ncbi:hypothetical protein [Fibrisoma montanum]|nr:hypothetical protein [Fibrisoma montanum]